LPPVKAKPTIRSSPLKKPKPARVGRYGRLEVSGGGLKRNRPSQGLSGYRTSLHRLSTPSALLRSSSALAIWSRVPTTRSIRCSEGYPCCIAW
jgi:hypothetical protein